jgi:NADPH:quinone reductase-like Zn-dependent oxidoreductase
VHAIGIREFGGIDQIVDLGLPVPSPSTGEVLVRVHAAGVGPWDALVREGTGGVAVKPPLVLGSDISGIVERVGSKVTHVMPGDEVFGVTNDTFTGAYAEHAVAKAECIDRKPTRLSHVEAASVPVIGTTAWVMLFEHAKVAAGRRVLVLGAAGNVGAYAVQLATRAGAEVLGVGHADALAAIRALGASHAIDAHEPPPAADVVIDTVGGEMLARSLDVVVPGGIVVSSVQPPDAARAKARGVRAAFFIVTVRRNVLHSLAERIDAGQLTTKVGEVLPLSKAREAHEMLAGKRGHARGKIVLRVE